MRSFKTAEDVKQFVEKEAVKIIDFKVIDMKGRWHHLSIPVERFTEDVMTLALALTVPVIAS